MQTSSGLSHSFVLQGKMMLKISLTCNVRDMELTIRGELAMEETKPKKERKKNCNIDWLHTHASILQEINQTKIQIEPNKMHLTNWSGERWNSPWMKKHVFNHGQDHMGSRSFLKGISWIWIHATPSPQGNQKLLTWKKRPFVDPSLTLGVRLAHWRGQILNHEMAAEEGRFQAV